MNEPTSPADRKSGQKAAISAAANTLVLGLGNELLADDGLGVHAVRAIMAGGRLPDRVDVLEIGTAILDGLEYLAAADYVVVVDAMKAGGRPGTIYEIALSACDSQPCIGSIHGFDIQRAMALVGRTDLPDVRVVGVEPSRIEWSLELSSELKAALPDVVAAVEHLALARG